MKKMLNEKQYILHSESDSGVSQWHFSRYQLYGLMGITSMVLVTFLFFGAD